MHTKMSPTQAMQELQRTDHAISREQAAGMVKSYKRFRSKLIKAGKTGGQFAGEVPTLPICLTYNRDAILNLMKTPGCAGVRMYPAINCRKQLTLVIVGVDESGANLLDAALAGGSKVVAKASSGVTLLDEGQASPPYPVPQDGL